MPASLLVNARRAPRKADRVDALRLSGRTMESCLLRAGVAAKIVELAVASVYMFLSNEADVVRELRAFVARLSHSPNFIRLRVRSSAETLC